MTDDNLSRTADAPITTNEALEMAKLWEKAGPRILSARAASTIDEKDLNEVALFLVRTVRHYHAMSYELKHGKAEEVSLWR